LNACINKIANSKLIKAKNIIISQKMSENKKIYISIVSLLQNIIKQCNITTTTTTTTTTTNLEMEK